MFRPSALETKKSLVSSEPSKPLENGADVKVDERIGSSFEDVLRSKAGLYTNSRKASRYPKTILVTASNYHYRSLLINWECYAQKLGLKWIVISMDPKVSGRNP